MIAARKSKDRKHIVCGACGRNLCRRDLRSRGDKTAAFLVWGDGWRVVVDEVRLNPLPPVVHIEMSERAHDRLLAGHKPGRKDWANEARFELSDALRRHVPATCPWCGTLNEIKPRTLDVDGVAAYSR